MLESVYVIFSRFTESPAGAAALPESFGSPASIGELLYSQYLLPFEVTSVLLLVAMIGAIVLTRKEKKL